MRPLLLDYILTEPQQKRQGAGEGRRSMADEESALFSFVFCLIEIYAIVYLNANYYGDFAPPAPPEVVGPF